MSLVDKELPLTLDNKLSKNCVDKLYAHISELEGYASHKSTPKIDKLNAFLEKIKRVLLFKTKVTMENYVTTACQLYTFSMIYDTLVSKAACETDYGTLVGHQKMWTEFLCNDKGRPMHKLYKWLATLGLLLLPCKCLYVSDKTNLLTNKKVIKEFYNPKLRISNKHAEDCIETLSRNYKKWMLQAHKFLSSAIRVREEFLTFKYCASKMGKAYPDEQHEFFQAKLERIDTALVDRCNQLRLTKIPLTVNYPK